MLWKILFNGLILSALDKYLTGFEFILHCLLSSHKQSNPFWADDEYSFFIIISIVRKFNESGNFSDIY